VLRIGRQAAFENPFFVSRDQGTGMESRRSRSAPRPTGSKHGVPPVKNARSKLRKVFVDEPVAIPSDVQDAVTEIRIRALRLADWNTIDRALLQTILCKRTAASYVAAYSEMLLAELDTNRCIGIYDWGCICVIDEVFREGYGIEQREEDAFKQYLDFLLHDVIYPCSSSTAGFVKPTDEDQDSLTLLFSGVKGRKNPIENDVVFLEPTTSAEDRRKMAMACSLALSQSLSLRSLELELQEWCAEQLNPLTLILAESGDVPDEEVTLRLFGRFYGFLEAVDRIGPALQSPADIDAEAKAMYTMAYEYLEVEARLKVMHERFDIIKSSLGLFKTLRESSESTRKERIIIYLLVVCVCIAALELLVKMSRHF
jgi:uncharacterized Rmd1/YagE family protein